MDVRKKLTHILTSDTEMLKNLNVSTIKLYRLIDKMIANGVTVQEWISVKDRLPNLDEAVLVLAEYLHIKTNYYEAWSLFKCESGETIWVDKYGNGHNLTEVTYWMPLPSAPKGETIY